MSIAVLVLAAGKSTRMKSIKQLLKIKDFYLLDLAINAAKKTQNTKVFCVLGDNAAHIKKSIQAKDCNFIINHNYHLGLSSSIICGVEHVTKQHKNSNAILITLADQPQVNTDFLTEIVQLSSKNPTKIIATAYENKVGVPALFPKRFFKDLLQLTGDVGAKKLIQKQLENTILINLKEPLLDIDTPEDYSKFINL